MSRANLYEISVLMKRPLHGGWLCGTAPSTGIRTSAFGWGSTYCSGGWLQCQLRSAVIVGRRDSEVVPRDPPPRPRSSLCVSRPRSPVRTRSFDPGQAVLTDAAAAGRAAHGRTHAAYWWSLPESALWWARSAGGRAVTPATLSVVVGMARPLALMLVNPGAVPAAVVVVSHAIRAARKRQQHCDQKVRSHAMEGLNGSR